MTDQNEHTVAHMTPDEALELLKSGNRRFLEKKLNQRDLLEQVARTGSGQHPFAVVLGCIDSRVPPELIFDQGIGDILSVRVAGNIVNEDILGSLEFATKVAGAKLVLVLGHTNCGAVKGAKDQVELGHLTALVKKIQPAVSAVRDVSDDPEVDQIAEINVKLSIEDIKSKSLNLFKLEEQGEIIIIGAMYDVNTGHVKFL